MKALLLTIGALAAALSLAVGLSSAYAANGSTVTGTKVAVASTRLGNVLVDGRGHTLYLFAKDRHGKSSCTGTVRWVLAATDRSRQATRGGRSEGIPPRHHEAPRRAPSGHLQPPSPLHLRQGHEARARQTARKSTPSAPSGTPSQPPEPRSRKPTQRAATAAATRQRAATGRVLGVTAHARRGPSAGPLLNRALPLAPPPAPDRRLTDLHNLFKDAVLEASSDLYRRSIDRAHGQPRTVGDCVQRTGTCQGGSSQSASGWWRSLRPWQRPCQLAGAHLFVITPHSAPGVMPVIPFGRTVVRTTLPAHLHEPFASWGRHRVSQAFRTDDQFPWD